MPTTVTYKSLRAKGTEAGLPAALQAKLGDLVEAGLECMAAAHSHGVKMAFGSDLLGTLHSWQSEEFNLRAQVRRRRAGREPV